MSASTPEPRPCTIEDDARSQASEHYAALQDAKFQLEQARIALLRETGDLAAWVGIEK